MSNNKEQDKYLYSFEVTDENAKKRKFCILKPNRKMKEAGELFYASKLSQFISAGILPKIVWDKVFKDSGGIISEFDQKEYSNLFMEFSEFRGSLDDILVKSEKDRTDDEKNRVNFLNMQIIRVRKRMQELEMAQVNAFENTAEAKARNRTIVWWAANLACEENSNGVADVLLGSGSIEDKLDNYDSIFENDKFLSDCFSRINYLVTIWYLGSASIFEDFKELDDEYLKRIESENLGLDDQPLSITDEVGTLENTDEVGTLENTEKVEVHNVDVVADLSTVV